MLTAFYPRRFSLFLFIFFAAGPIFAQDVRVTIAPSLHTEALDGRLLLLMANNAQSEPRFQVSDGAGTQLVFGIDVAGWKPGESQLVGVNAFGYPLERLADVPAGDYYFQVVLH